MFFPIFAGRNALFQVNLHSSVPKKRRTFLDCSRVQQPALAIGHRLSCFFLLPVGVHGTACHGTAWPLFSCTSVLFCCVHLGKCLAPLLPLSVLSCRAMCPMRSCTGSKMRVPSSLGINEFRGSPLLGACFCSRSLVALYLACKFAGMHSSVTSCRRKEGFCCSAVVGTAFCCTVAPPSCTNGHRQAVAGKVVGLA